MPSETSRSEKDHLARGFAMAATGLSLAGLEAAGAMHTYGLFLALGIVIIAAIEMATHYSRSFRGGEPDV